MRPQCYHQLVQACAGVGRYQKVSVGDLNAKVGFGAHPQDWHAVGDRWPLIIVGNSQGKFCGGQSCHGAANTLSLNRIGRLSKAGSVEQRDRDAIYDDSRFENVSCCASDW